MQVPQHAALVATTRGERAECVHYGSFAVVDSTGKLLAGAGEPDALNFTRSALKPLQALPFVEDGGMARWGFDSRHLAMMCASHGGEPVHVGLVAGMLQRIGARVEDLGCGCHAPSFFSTTGAAPPRRARWSSLHHNCSGKHSGFLAWCRMQGQPMQNYLDAQAPLQERIRKIVQRFAGSHPIAMGIDGCSAPNYALPLSALARSYCSLALGDGDALAAISYAMRRHPDLVSGSGRFDLALMQAGAGDWVCKGGADGVQAIGIRSRGIGIAVRIADGSARAVRATTLALLRDLGLLGAELPPALATLAPAFITNYRGTRVGAVHTLFEALRVRA